MNFLPRLLLITNRHQMQPNFEAALEAALIGGTRLVQLREKDLTSHELLDLARRAQKLCERYGARLLINSRADIAAAVGAAGVHLPENEIPSSAARAVLHQPALCGVSVHSAETARRAADEGADYLVFGSVFPTSSHPGEAPQGLETLRCVAGTVNCPVFAVGGITAAQVEACLEAGAHGVAVISAVWGEPDVAVAVRIILKALGES